MMNVFNMLNKCEYLELCKPVPQQLHVKCMLNIFITDCLVVLLT